VCSFLPDVWVAMLGGCVVGGDVEYRVVDVATRRISWLFYGSEK
jgi:hypothetical protein